MILKSEITYDDSSHRLMFRGHKLSTTLEAIQDLKASGVFAETIEREIFKECEKLLCVIRDKKIDEIIGT